MMVTSPLGRVTGTYVTSVVLCDGSTGSAIIVTSPLGSVTGMYVTSVVLCDGSTVTGT